MFREHSHNAWIKSGEAPFNTALITAGLAPHNNRNMGTFLFRRADMVIFEGTLQGALVGKVLSSDEDDRVSLVASQTANNREA